MKFNPTSSDIIKLFLENLKLSFDKIPLENKSKLNKK